MKAVPCSACLHIGDQAAKPRRQRHVEQRHLGAEHPHPHQPAGQQHQAVAGQGQKRETRFEITTRQVTSRPTACIWIKWSKSCCHMASSMSCIW